MTQKLDSALVDEYGPKYAWLEFLRQHTKIGYRVPRFWSPGSALWNAYYGKHDGKIVQYVREMSSGLDIRVDGLCAADGRSLTNMPTRALFLPSDVEEKYLREIKQRFTGPVMFRSSVANEDRKGATQAGKYHSEMQDVQKLNKRALSMFIDKNLNACAAGPVGQEIPPIGIIVQEYVYFDTGGVMFTHTPGRPEVTLLEAAIGGPEFATKGMFIDRFALRDGQIKVYTNNAMDEEISQEHQVRLKQKAYTIGLEFPIQKTRYVTNGTFCNLSETQAYRVREVGLRLADLLGCPQDIEFGYSDNDLYVIQTRPAPSTIDVPALPQGELLFSTITTLSPGVFTGPLFKIAGDNSTKALYKDGGNKQLSTILSLIEAKFPDQEYGLIGNDIAGIDRAQREILLQHSYLRAFVKIGMVGASVDHRAISLREQGKIVATFAEKDRKGIMHCLDYHFSFGDQTIYHSSKPYAIHSDGLEGGLYRAL